MSKTLGVLLYIDDTPNMLEEFSWIYKSWIYSGNWKTSDLIAVCNPAAYAKLPGDSGVVRIPHEPLSEQPGKWEGDRFINSIGCLVGDHTREIAARYTHFLRSDADVFLTRNLVDFRPSVAVHGRGRYALELEVREKLVEFAKRHSLKHHGVFNCGSSLLAPSGDVLFFLQEQLTVCEWLLGDFRDGPGEWPGWFRGVITMYAAELVANHYWELFTLFGLQYTLDFESNLRARIDQTNIYHIHAGPVSGHWSKFEYRAGEYAGYDINRLDLNIVHDYCHWIAEARTEDIKRISDYPE
jgi:hypothetical protein